MDIKMNNNFSSIQQVTGTYFNRQQPKSEEIEKDENSFEKIFKKKSEAYEAALKFSKHAGYRLEQRNISLSDEQLSRLEQATKKADEKGIKESLMIMDGMAFIVNVKSNTVITAMEQNEDSENVFTNIDGAVIA